MPEEVERDNPDMTIAQQCRSLAAWNYWQELRAAAMSLDVDD